ncbi:hypothetical protein PR202_ga28120 [Eleusine coracana subsp. coracana]|uniref:Uncharacterized protein n=1 Tax=Eleusine coracana subsp. coracana TaxID=191504 RepID=A0AAV5DIM6_ELECO|nr:hypothetical protein PR202_ga28120 [Eleusine coracana subsp. coracana]
MFSAALPGRSQRRLADAPGSPAPPWVSAAAAVVPSERSVPQTAAPSTLPRRAPHCSSSPRARRNSLGAAHSAASPPHLAFSLSLSLSEVSPRSSLAVAGSVRSCAFERGSRAAAGGAVG